MASGRPFSYIEPEFEMNAPNSATEPILTQAEAARPAEASKAPRRPLAGRDIYRMNGAGNASLVLDLRGSGVAATAEDARALPRAPDLAYDQLMVLADPRAGEDAFLTIFNQDGSLSSACGNGTRCVAHYLAQKTGAKVFRFATDAGELSARRDGPMSYTVDMGRPRFDWRDIPLAHAVDDALAVDLQKFGLPPSACLGMGNPHAVFFVEDAEKFDLAAIGPALEHDPIFPRRANISLAQVLSRDEVRLKVWERGTGLTLACGSAACATLVAAASAGLTGRRAKILLPGGELVVHWRESDDHVELTGPVELEFMRQIDAACFETAPP
jgi:diaminopimelate epimerase